MYIESNNDIYISGCQLTWLAKSLEGVAKYLGQILSTLVVAFHMYQKKIIVSSASICLKRFFCLDEPNLLFSQWKPWLVFFLFLKGYYWLFTNCMPQLSPLFMVS